MISFEHHNIFSHGALIDKVVMLLFSGLPPLNTYIERIVQLFVGNTQREEEQCKQAHTSVPLGVP